jgi:hypothetical protein
MNRRKRKGGADLVAAPPATESSTAPGVATSPLWRAFWAFQRNRTHAVSTAEGSWRCGLCNICWEAAVPVCLSCLGPRLLADTMAFGLYPPSLGHTPPSLGHTPPSLGHTPPSLGHTPPSLGHTPPSLGYEPFSLGHEPPSLGYEPPSLGHAS